MDCIFELPASYMALVKRSNDNDPEALFALGFLIENKYKHVREDEAQNGNLYYYQKAKKCGSIEAIDRILKIGLNSLEKDVNLIEKMQIIRTYMGLEKAFQILFRMNQWIIKIQILKEEEPQDFG